jgi:MFS family permease
VPARLDALGWSRWHKRVIVALGITWILDGLEASLISALGATLQDPRTLSLSATEVGLTSTMYLAGQVLGALVFGHLTDRHGRKQLFLVTLALYLVSTALSGLAPNLAVFVVFRFFAGAGIGGEYAAINSAIDELVPARLRGQIDLGINGSYWVGAAMAFGLSLVVLDPAIIPIEYGWRIAFGLGSILGLAILIIRRHVPESPRWLLLHGRDAEAREVVATIEEAAGGLPKDVVLASVRIHVKRPQGLGALIHTLFVRYPRRAVLGVVLMLSQAFLYNAIFFSYPLVLKTFHGVSPEDVGLYGLPFAAANFMGPLLLGRMFDRVGRRSMISATYALSGVLLAITGGLFVAGVLDAFTQTVCWSIVFFFASAAASSAYLTVSELFPLELRGMAIAVFYAFGTSIAAIAPTLFGMFVDTGNPVSVFHGYLLATLLMCVAAVIARTHGVDAERRSLEELNPHD